MSLPSIEKWADRGSRAAPNARRHGLSIAPDPRVVETAHHPPGQADVQHSLPGRHGEGRARNQG
ncbi:MAG: hypothetical protein ACRDJ3_03250, partial [Solirubrobacteraceae bacterium]